MNPAWEVLKPIFSTKGTEAPGFTPWGARTFTCITPGSQPENSSGILHWRIHASDGSRNRLNWSRGNWAARLSVHSGRIGLTP